MTTSLDTHLQFRAAGHDDVDALVTLVESAYRGDASRVGWTTEADLLDGRRTGVDDIASCIDRDRSMILIGERDGELLACAHVAAERSDDVGDVGYFGMFSVHPQLQGAGLGKAMLAQAERIAREQWQLPVMRMAVIDLREELIAFYQRRGYHRIGIFKPFPYGDERFGLPRRDDLRFEILEKTLTSPLQQAGSA